MRYLIACLLGLLAIQPDARASMGQVSMDGPSSAYDCGDPAALGPLTGLYQTDSGRFVCLLDFGTFVELPDPHLDRWSRSFGKLDRLGEATELSGRAYLTGYAYQLVSTVGGGSIRELVPCPFEVATKLDVLREGEMLWSKPIVIFNTDCCNLVTVRYETEHLVRVEAPSPQPKPEPKP